MCMSNIGDPLGILKYKWADPLGLTKTAVGDPLNLTGQRTKPVTASAAPPAPAYLPSEYVAQAGSAQQGIPTKSTNADRARALYGNPKLNTLSYG